MYKIWHIPFHKHKFYGKERRPELLTPADPNPPQPTRSAFPQCPATACVLLT